MTANDVPSRSSGPELPFPDETKARIERTPCPKCGGQLKVEMKLRAKSIGDFSLSGRQMKVSAVESPRVTCQRCKVSAAIEAGDGS